MAAAAELATVVAVQEAVMGRLTALLNVQTHAGTRGMLVMEAQSVTGLGLGPNEVIRTVTML